MHNFLDPVAQWSRTPELEAQVGGSNPAGGKLLWTVLPVTKNILKIVSC